jgi:hypothetical protein
VSGQIQHYWYDAQLKECLECLVSINNLTAEERALAAIFLF